MRQLAVCAYCGRGLCDAFEVDHVNECRSDDRECNLVAACALCHAIKSRHVRLGRDWSGMRAAIDRCRAAALDRWRTGAGHGDLPGWLRQRVSRADARVYTLTVNEPPAFPFDLEQYRYGGPRRL